MRAGAARIGDQLVPLDAQRILQLQRLDRRVIAVGHQPEGGVEQELHLVVMEGALLLQGLDVALQRLDLVLA